MKGGSAFWKRVLSSVTSIRWTAGNTPYDAQGTSDVTTRKFTSMMDISFIDDYKKN